MINNFFLRVSISLKKVKLILFLCMGCLFSICQNLPAKNNVLVEKNNHDDLATAIGLIDTFPPKLFADVESKLQAISLSSNVGSTSSNGGLLDSGESSSPLADIFPTETTSELFAYPYRRSIFDFNMQAESFSLRTNMLSWVALTPDLGVEWIINRDLGLVIDASWTTWKFGNMGYRYALWTVSPEFRYYAGEEKQWFIGLYYMMGDYNFRFSEIGHQGHYMGGGLSLGYALNLSNTFALDFHLGAGLIFSDCENYKVMYGYSIRDSKEMVKYPGINKVGVTLVWKLGSNKYQRER